MTYYKVLERKRDNRLMSPVGYQGKRLAYPLNTWIKGELSVLSDRPSRRYGHFMPCLNAHRQLELWKVEVEGLHLVWNGLRAEALRLISYEARNRDSQFYED